MTDDLDLASFAEAKSDQLGGDDLIGGPRTITITGVTGAIEEGKKRAIIHFDGDNGKPFKPCKTMLRLMMAVWGTRARNYVGKSLTVYRDPDVTFGALATGGVRISHMSHMESDTAVILTLKKGKKGVVKVKPLQQRQNTPAASLPDAAADAPPTDAGQLPTGAASNEDKAADWLGNYIADLAECKTQQDVILLNEKRGKGLAKLANDRPELSQIATDSSTQRYEALADAEQEY